MNSYNLFSTALLELIQGELEQVLAKNPANSPNYTRAQDQMRLVRDVLQCRLEDPCTESCLHAM